MVRPLVWFITLLIVCDATAAAQSDDASTNDEQKQMQAKEILEHMQGMRFERATDNRQSVELIDRPLLKYTDPVRANVQGTVWAWGREGRPLALMEVFRPSAEGQWIHATTLISTDLIVATIADNLKWSPQTSGIRFQTIPSSSPPAEREALRLGQLKDLARKFEAHEFWDPNNSRYELRLLVQPIHRYRDPEKKILDGAIFLLAHGTNPEIALLIEAQGEALDSSKWRFAASRLGSAELHLLLNNEEVWSQPRAPNIVGKPTDPYWLFFSNSKKAISQ